MQTKLLSYNIIIKKEGNDYIAYVPTLNISDFGKSVTDAKTNVQKAIQIHIEGLIKTKTKIPSPDSQEFYISQSEINVPINTQFAY